MATSVQSTMSVQLTPIAGPVTGTSIAAHDVVASLIEPFG